MPNDIVERLRRVCLETTCPGCIIDRKIAADIIDELQAELALTVARAENAERALVEADERHSRYVKADGELAGMAARLAEMEQIMDDALGAMLETECPQCNAAFVKARRKRATDSATPRENERE